MQLWIHVQIWFLNITRWICCKKFNKSFGLWKKVHCEFQGTIILVLIYTHDLSHLCLNYVSTFPSHLLHMLHSYNLNLGWSCTWHLHTFLTNNTLRDWVFTLVAQIHSKYEHPCHQKNLFLTWFVAQISYNWMCYNQLLHILWIPIATYSYEHNKPECANDLPSKRP